MQYYTQVKQIRETEAGTDLIIHIPEEQLKYKISKYSKGNTVDAEIRINDDRAITADQRKKIFATIRDIAKHTVDDPEYIRKMLLCDYCASTGEMPFSLSNCSGNAYGYWTGKDYTVNGVKYPITKDRKGLDVKLYHNKKVATNALNRCIDKYECVLSARVEEITIGVHVDNKKI